MIDDFRILVRPQVQPCLPVRMSLTSCAGHRFLASSFRREYKEAGPSLNGGVLLMRLHHRIASQFISSASARLQPPAPVVGPTRIPTKFCL